MSATLDEGLRESLVELAVTAGRAVMQVYDDSSRMWIETKEDDSPLTAADRASHEVIARGLEALAGQIPLVSEEGRDIPYAERSGWDRMWVVDPLDGTKEFIKRNGEFTVNIALVEHGRTVWGVVHAPAVGETYWGGSSLGSMKRRTGGPPCPIKVAAEAPEAGLIVVKSRSHPSPEVEEFLSRHKVAEALSVGSSLKFCAVADGRAHLYPRMGPTMEWDTAAGQAVVEGAGGKVVTPWGEPFVYNKESLLNGPFVVTGPEGLL